MSDYGLKVGDKIKSPWTGKAYLVEAIFGPFALVRRDDSLGFPIFFEGGAWRSRSDGDPWTVVKSRWRAERRGGYHVIYDGDRHEGCFAVALWDDDTDLTADEIAETVEAIVELLNERFPA